MPSVLIETGFLSNLKEEAFIVKPAGQDYIARSIFNAFSEYKKNVDSRRSYTTKLQLTKQLDSSSTNIASQNKRLEKQKVDIVFKVQITSSKRKIPSTSKYFKDIKGIDEFNADGIFKYTVGNKKSYSEIVEFCQQIRKQFPDAFIIAVKGNKIIPLDIALKEISI